MILQIIIALLAGILAGTLTGLFPGIHINLVAAILLTIFTKNILDSTLALALITFIVAMALTHTFLDFIPSIYLGAPEEDSFLSVLPGHQMLKEGKGHEAVVHTLFGSLSALPIILIFTPLFLKFLPVFFNLTRAIIPYLLVFISLYLIFREEEFWISLTVFLFSGVLGLLAFNLPIKEPILPLLSGLFGISGLVVSLKEKIKIPIQKITKLREIKLEKKKIFKSSFAAALTAPLSSFFPGVGAGQAAVIGSEILGKEAEEKTTFLFLVGAISTIVMALSFVTIFAINRTRTGAAVAVKEILGEITKTHLSLILLIVIISSLSAFFIGIFISSFFAKNITKINYSILSSVIIFLVLLVNMLISNFLGLLLLITTTALGVFTILSKARRINLMGSLLVPTILFYLLA